MVLAGSDAGLRIGIGGAEWEVPSSAVLPPGPAVLRARPEALWLTGAQVPGAVRGTVERARFAGATVTWAVRLPDGSVLEVSGSAGAAEPGQAVGVRPSRRAGGGLHLFAPGAE